MLLKAPSTIVVSTCTMWTPMHGRDAAFTALTAQDELGSCRRQRTATSVHVLPICKGRTVSKKHWGGQPVVAGARGAAEMKGELCHCSSGSNWSGQLMMTSKASDEGFAPQAITRYEASLTFPLPGSAVPGPGPVGGRAVMVLQLHACHLPGHIARTACIAAQGTEACTLHSGCT
ncbi:uncharacterized protein VDAG_06630 [Verticillium dahliae VdLs.17]|uniref:Uncharacterized protein n=1 Tax=Verticillium dahliae (strain VdLs.17 / ATCC MYA-4575 / FGSC 10137) TaxID=498257 RepID=G2X8Z8_VERDV|nr:uncharacterized protein VDAG_06630 [Verticillium dahliae VdLs.17]EGY15466.1 hypothetical protein VDAG_06630 [Verticillium dahliae VdLs.17]KAH6687535.1 hypothetical protein EV126DRAFT_349402 [Verticillium dahliae]